MARLPRLALPDLPYHVTQRGNRRQAVFFEPADFQAYKALLAHWCRQIIGGVSPSVDLIPEWLVGSRRNASVLVFPQLA